MTKIAAPSFPAIFTGNQDELRQFDKDMASEMARFASNLISILDGGLSLDDNADISMASVQSHGTPGAEFSVAHGLGKTPTGYITYGQTGAGSIYDGATANTNATAYFRSDAAAVTFKIIFF